MKTQFQRIDDDRFLVLIDGKPNSIFRIKNWMNGLVKEPDRKSGSTHTNRFSITQAKYNGFFE